MKKVWFSINLIFNFLIGFISKSVLVLSYKAATNTLKNTPSYYNPEGESLMIFGWIFLFLYFIILILLDLLMIKKLKLTFWKGLFLELFIIFVGVIISLATGFPHQPL